MEDQNAVLLEKYESAAEAKEKMYDELQIVLEENKHLRALSDNRYKASVETEIKLTARVQSLEGDIASLSAKVTQLENANETYRKQNIALLNKLRMVDELRAEQIARSRQTEYRTLERINELQELLQREKDEKAQVYENFRLACRRGDMLQSRLSSAIESSHLSMTSMAAVVDDVEQQYDKMLQQTKRLARKNEHLQTNLQVTRRAVDVLSKRASRRPSTSSSTSTLSLTSQSVKKLGRKGELHDQGRRCLMAKYLSLYPRGFEALDLSQCSITDIDVQQLVEKLRQSLTATSILIDLRHNAIAESGFRGLIAWIASLSREEVIRTQPLVLDLRHNQISMSSINEACSQLRRLSRPEISLVTNDLESDVIAMYCPKELLPIPDTIDSNSHGSNSIVSKSNPHGHQLIIRIDCRDNQGSSSSSSLSVSSPVVVIESPLPPISMTSNSRSSIASANKSQRSTNTNTNHMNTNNMNMSSDDRSVASSVTAPSYLDMDLWDDDIKSLNSQTKMMSISMSMVSGEGYYTDGNDGNDGNSGNGDVYPRDEIMHMRPEFL